MIGGGNPFYLKFWTDRRQTDRRTTTYGEHEHEFTFAKNEKKIIKITAAAKTMTTIASAHLYLTSQ